MNLSHHKSIVRFQRHELTHCAGLLQVLRFLTEKPILSFGTQGQLSEGVAAMTSCLELLIHAHFQLQKWLSFDTGDCPPPTGYPR